MNRRALLFAVTTLAAGLGATTNARAAVAQTVHYQNATGFCQPALPVFEGNIRKRPTAIANEGTSNAFVSCSMTSLPEAGAAIELPTLAVYNRTAADIDVTCSLVHSYEAGGLVVPKTLSIPAGDREFFEWTLADIGDPPSFDFLNFNCNLPVGVDIGYGYYYYSYEIGT